MGFALKKLVTLGDLRAIPLSGIGTASVGSVLELTDHVLDDDATQRFLGVWVHGPGTEIQRYLKGMVGRGRYAFPDVSPGDLYGTVDLTFAAFGHARDRIDAPIATADISNFVVYQWVFPYALRSDVLAALHPHNELKPLMR